MRKKIAIILLTILGCYSYTSQAQQDAQYTQYMYNTISVNPAYAGSREMLSILALYRTQWTGLEGAPRTFTLSAHSPVSKNIGLGINVTRDEIFISQESYIDLDFSYALTMSEKAKLALGLKVGGHILDIDSNRLMTGAFNPNDPDAEINIDNKFSPQFGVGAYYYTDKFYLGLSAPNLLETDHFEESNRTTATAKERINYYLISGYVFDLNEDLQFKPAVLTKLVTGAPLQVDLSASFLFYQKLSLGVAYRWSAALSGMIGFQLSDKILIGFAYDRETTDLRQYNDGSYEMFLRFELFNRTKGMKNPRFF